MVLSAGLILLVTGRPGRGWGYLFLVGGSNNTTEGEVKKDGVLFFQPLLLLNATR